MSLSCLVSWPGKPGGPEPQPLKALPDLLKAHPEGLSRGPYFCPAGDPEGIREAAAVGSLALGGPFTVVHSIRRASDLLLEECGYEGMAIGLEVEGKKLPELPSRAEIESLLTGIHTLVLIDGRGYRPATEVFGFQQVYDDTVRFIDGLKNLGVPNDAMSLFATPDEIVIEVHPDVLGVTETPALPGLYRALLGKLAGFKRSEKRPLKTTDKTVILDATRFDATILIPGSGHPVLHRPKVGVGPSHFAYGPAAFSDYCGKKRTIDECIKEVRTWIKFLETPHEAIPKLKEIVARLEAVAGVEAAAGGGPAEAAAAAAGAGMGLGLGAGGFQPLGAELRSQPPVFPGGGAPLSTPFAELNRTLGGGFSVRGVHLITGGREEGKAALLMNLALAFAAKRSVLFLSREMTQIEFAGRLLAQLRKLPAVDWAAKAAASGAEGENVRKQLGEALAEVGKGLPPCLYFRGTDSSVRIHDVNEVVELLKMMPAGDGAVLFLEGMRFEEIDEDYLRKLRTKALSQNFTACISIHLPGFGVPQAASPSPMGTSASFSTPSGASNPVQTPTPTSPLLPSQAGILNQAITSLPNPVRPQFVEGLDIDITARYGPIAETIFHLQSDRMNLKRFLAMAQGKVDPAVAEKLEARFTAAAANERRKGDTFSLLRLLHARWGSRQAILYLYQRELARFLEGPALALGRP
ncbi:MAG: hypothetical protein WA705_09175 [Candidatus Ozemobacteraceae bacterium]